MTEVALSVILAPPTLPGQVRVAPEDVKSDQDEASALLSMNRDEA